MTEEEKSNKGPTPLHLRNQNAKLHPQLLDILFHHRREISKKFSDVLELHYINHVATIISNPEREIVIFSTTPTVEYNLISSEMWPHDGTISPTFYKTKTFFWWTDAYHQNHFLQLQNIKEKKHNLTLGFCLVREIGDFHLIYSFATRSKRKDLEDYYLAHMDDLLAIGDYCYKLIRDLYCNYSPSYHPPIINEQTALNLKARPYLQLIVNNQP